MTAGQSEGVACTVHDFEMCSSEAQARIASNVFNYLSESSDWWEIESKFCEDCNTHYLRGKRTKDSESVVVLPTSVNVMLNFEAIQNLLSCLPPASKVTLALQDGDTSVVFYDVAPGIVYPSDFGVGAGDCTPDF